MNEAAEEPVLRMRNIQGVALPGFFKPFQTLLCVWHRHDPATVAEVKRFLCAFAPEVSSGRSTLSDRRTHRHLAGRHKGKPPHPRAAAKLAHRKPLVGIAFTYPGLLCLAKSAEEMRSEAFRAGLAARSTLLGDPAVAGIPGHRDGWVVGKPGKEPSFMIIVAGDSDTLVVPKVAEIRARVEAFSTCVREEPGHVIEDPVTGKAREHFGFVDGISQPGIRGRATRHARNHLTHRSLVSWPGSALEGLPGQALVWPGEFVLGYPRSGPDPLWPGPVDPPQPAWTRDGSFLVFRRLQQDVGRFWNSMKRQAGELAGHPGFAGITPESLAAQLVGRRRDGTPISRLPGLAAGSCPALGRKAMANNNFRFDSDTPPPLLQKGIDPFPRAQADPLGLACPLAAHIRKVNPRDAASDTGGASGTYARRILRVGITYGTPSADVLEEPAGSAVDRGVLFLSIQASIEDQFEFLQARWMNDERRPKAPSGHDMIAGRNAADPHGAVQCTIFGSGGEQARVAMMAPAVIPTGGGYFFVPSLHALRTVLAAPAEAGLSTAR